MLLEHHAFFFFLFFFVIRASCPENTTDAEYKFVLFIVPVLLWKELKRKLKTCGLYSALNIGVALR